MFKILKSYIILIAILLNSSIFAINVNFSNPTSTPPGTTPPDLSDPRPPGGNAFEPQVATSDSGQYAYVTWKRDDGPDFATQVAVTSDYGKTWADPTTTPPGTTTPNLSEAGEVADEPQIATSSSGKYVYVVWDREESFDAVIQVAISHDFGVTWQNPTSTPPGTSTPDLSVGGNVSEHPQVDTDSSGQHVYVTWFRTDASSDDIVQVAISSDYGVTWQNPTTTPTGVSPNLSDAGNSAFDDQVITNCSGQYVYALWQRSDGLRDIVQIAISSDYGVTWADPTTTPPGTTTPNLSIPGFQADEPQLSTNCTGQYVYVVWDQVNSSGNEIVQITISSDFGVTWQNPSSTPPGTSSPNLSTPGGNGEEPFVVTDDTGRYVHASWYREGANDIIQTASSFDFGKTWHNPTTTPPGTISPNLSLPGGDAKHVRIGADRSGRYIYISWHRHNGIHNVIQTTFSSDFGVTWQNPTSTPPGTSTPNLSVAGPPGGAADEPAIAVDATGRNVYISWYRNDGTDTRVQVTNGFKTFFPIKNLTFKRGD